MKKTVTRGKVKSVEFGPNGYIKLNRNKEDITICNICNEEIKLEEYEQTEIKFEAKIGSYYPEGDSRYGYRIDICEECFMNKIKPLIEQTYQTKFKEFSCDDYKYTEHEEVPLTDEELKAAMLIADSEQVREAIKNYNIKLKKENENVKQRKS